MRPIILHTMALLLATATVSATTQTAPQAAKPSVEQRATLDFKSALEQAQKNTSTHVTEVGVSLPGTLYETDLKDYAEHIRWQRDFARRSWDWHLFSTQLLMLVVLGIVAFGLLITYLQFTRDVSGPARRKRSAEPALATPGTVSTPDVDAQDAAADGTTLVNTSSTLKITTSGLELTSQIIGLMVLGFSLAFFYFYVQVVYPMQELKLHEKANEAQEQQPAKTPKETTGMEEVK